MAEYGMMHEFRRLATAGNTDDRFIVGHNMFVCTCTTAASTAQKDVTFASGQGSFILENLGINPYVGMIIAVKFTNTNTASNPKIKLGTFVAKSIYKGSAVVTSSNKTAAGIASTYTYYLYDGTNWVWLGDGNTAL